MSIASFLLGIYNTVKAYVPIITNGAVGAARGVGLYDSLKDDKNKENEVKSEGQEGFYEKDVGKGINESPLEASNESTEITQDKSAKKPGFIRRVLDFAVSPNVVRTFIIGLAVLPLFMPALAPLGFTVAAIFCAATVVATMAQYCLESYQDKKLEVVKNEDKKIHSIIVKSKEILEGIGKNPELHHVLPELTMEKDKGGLIDNEEYKGKSSFLKTMALKIPDNAIEALSIAPLIAQSIQMAHPAMWVGVGIAGVGTVLDNALSVNERKKIKEQKNKILNEVEYSKVIMGIDYPGRKGQELLNDKLKNYSLEQKIIEKMGNDESSNLDSISAIKQRTVEKILIEGEGSNLLLNDISVNDLTKHVDKVLYGKGEGIDLNTSSIKIQDSLKEFTNQFAQKFPQEIKDTFNKLHSDVDLVKQVNLEAQSGYKENGFFKNLGNRIACGFSSGKTAEINLQLNDRDWSLKKDIKELFISMAELGEKKIDSNFKEVSREQEKNLTKEGAELKHTNSHSHKEEFNVKKIISSRDHDHDNHVNSIIFDKNRSSNISRN